MRILTLEDYFVDIQRRSWICTFAYVPQNNTRFILVKLINFFIFGQHILL